MVFSLAFEKRDPKLNTRSFHKAGKMPAVFYGKRQAATPITIGTRNFEKIWKKAGESAVVSLTGPDGEVEALIHDIDKHPVTGIPRHADFYVFEKGQKLKIKVPIEFIGVAPAVKDLGGGLVKVLHGLEIEAAPKDLPQKIEVDISSLVAFDSVIAAKQIALPKGVTLISLPDEVVASVYEPKEEVVEEVPVDLSAIEVVKKGKELKEGEAEAEAVAAAPEGAKQESKKKEEKK